MLVLNCWICSLFTCFWLVAESAGTDAAVSSDQQFDVQPVPSILALFGPFSLFVEAIWNLHTISLLILLSRSPSKALTLNTTVTENTSKEANDYYYQEEGENDSILYYRQQEVMEEEAQQEHLLTMPNCDQRDIPALAFSADSARLAGVPEEEEEQEDWPESPQDDQDRFYYYYSEGDVPNESTRLNDIEDSAVSYDSDFSQGGYNKELDMDEPYYAEEDCYRRTYSR